jgi:hypothetical protein
MCLRGNGDKRATSSSATRCPRARSWAKAASHVDSVPERDAVQNEPEGAELFFHTVLVALVERALLAVAEVFCQAMSAFLQVTDPVGCKHAIWQLATANCCREVRREG